MSKYYNAITRKPSGGRDTRALLESSLLPREAAHSTSVISLPTLEQRPAVVARSADIRDLNERLAPMAAVKESVRLLVSGCRRGDGASTVAAALAIDLSQRLGLRTLLLDAYLRHPSLHHLIVSNRNSPELILEGSLQRRSTEWPRLELLTCCPEDEEEQKELLQGIENVFDNYAMVVVDLGVARLDARMLALARPADPILLVVRQGQTERRELSTSALALRAANRSLAGVIMNDAKDPVAKPIRRLLNKWSSL